MDNASHYFVQTSASQIILLPETFVHALQIMAMSAIKDIMRWPLSQQDYCQLGNIILRSG